VAANVVDNGGNCDKHFLAKEAAAVATAAREIFLRVMFKILLLHYFSKSNILNINLDLPVVLKDRQLAVLVAHVATTMRRLTNTQRRGQATVVKAEAEQGQTTINQKVAAKMFKILL
jgi:hypothetical protein